MELDDSNSDFYFNSVTNNHNSIDFLGKNEFLRENYTRPTNDVSNLLSFSEDSSFQGPFDDIPLRNKQSDQIDSDLIYFKTKNEQNINNTNNPSNNNEDNESEPKQQPKPKSKQKPKSKSKQQSKPKSNKQPEPKHKSKKKVKANLFDVKKDNSQDITSGLTYFSYAVLIFILFGQKKPKGRTPDFYKKNANYYHNPKHSKNNLDNFKTKVIRGCFKEIGLVIFSICLSFGEQYRIKKLNKAYDISTIESILYLCNKTMLDLFVNNNPRNIKDNSPNRGHNRRIYERLVNDGKLDQSPLLTQIFGMTFGEVLFKFINDDNFVKQIDPNYNLKTLSDIYGNIYSDELIESLQQNLGNLLGTLYG